MENLCACPNPACADYGAENRPSKVLTASLLIERLRSKGWWNGDHVALELLTPILDELCLFHGDIQAAAGELTVALDDAPPGSLPARLLRANRILRSERATLQRQLEDQRDAMRLFVASLQQIPAHLAVGSEARGIISAITTRCEELTNTKPVSTPSTS